MASAESVSDRMHRCHTTGLSGALAEKWPMALNGYFDLETYIYATPGHLKFAGVAGHPTHTQEHLQAIQEHKDQILSP